MYDDATLYRHLDRELPAEAADAIEAAARSDAALRTRIETLRARKEAVLAGAPVPAEGFPDRLAALASRPALRLPSLGDHRPASRWLLVAATLLIAVGLANLVVGLRAAPGDSRSVKSVQEKVDEYAKTYALDATQRRKLFDILLDLDREVDRILQPTPEQQRLRNEAQDRARGVIRGILTPDQQRKYDERTPRK
jgi:hypothetical protein